MKKQSTRQGFSRGPRLSSVIHEEISKTLSNSWDFEGLSISRVELNVDCTVADVYVREGFVHDQLVFESDKKDYVTSLQSRGKSLHLHLGRVLKLKHVPELRFHYDSGLDASEQIDKLLKRDN